MAEADDDGRYVVEEEVTTIPGWTASVTLDVQEHVQSGEEDEEELYSQRSKLYRFRDSEWKERGLGEARLLKHKGTGKVRFLFRQEKTLKIVSNHYPIRASDNYCDLRPNAGSEKCWVWTAQDFSEDEACVEQFALKFGKAELASAFKEAFDSAKELNSTVPGLMVEEGQPPAQQAPADHRSNGAAARTDAKAEAAAPLAASPAPEAPNPFAGVSLLSGSAAGAPPPTDTAFGNAFAGAAAGGLFASGGAPPGGLFGGSGAAPQTGGLFSSLSGSAFPSSGSSGGGLFGAAASGSLFSAPAQNGGGLFGGGAAQPAPAPSPGGGDAGDDGEYMPEEEVTTVEGWAPSMTLEVKEAVEMGTEQEDEIYSQRSKLFRFADGEWKERGLGDAKLLKHRDTGTVRFLLRQEKTMKIVANHVVLDHDVYCRLEKNADSDKIWVWSALDWADEEQQAEKFGLKFGNVELAGKFREAFENAKQLNSKAGGTGGARAPGDAPAPTASSGGAGSGLFASSGASSGGLFGGTALAGGLFSSRTTSGGAAHSGPLAGAAPAAPEASGSLFSAPAQNGGGLFGGGAAQPAPAPSPGGGDAGDDGEYMPEEEVTTIPGWAPSVSLEVLDTVATGEEEEEEVYSQRSKLYRFRDGEWKERGLGEAKLLKHKTSGKVRFMLRQEKTMKIVANHFALAVGSLCDLKPNMGSEKCWQWMAQDCSEDEPVVEQFGLKFGNADLATAFKEAFDSAKQQNLKVKEFADRVAAAVGEAGAAPDSAAKHGEQPKPKPAAEPRAHPSALGSGSGGAPAGTSSSPPEVSGAPTGSSGSGLFGGLGSGGSLFGGAAPSAGGGLFGGGAATSGGLFGAPASSGAGSQGSAASSGSLFGGSASSGSLFGGSASSGSLFGGSAASGSLFGGSASSGSLFGDSAASGSLFGGSASSGSLFGGSAASGSLFGGSAASGSLFGGSAASGSLFGDSAASGSLFGSSAASGSLFGGSAASGSLFGGSAASGSLFGGSAASGSLFGGSAASGGWHNDPGASADRGNLPAPAATADKGKEDFVPEEDVYADGGEEGEEEWEEGEEEEEGEEDQEENYEDYAVGVAPAAPTPAPPAPPASGATPIFGLAPAAPAGAAAELPAPPAPPASGGLFGLAPAAPASAGPTPAAVPTAAMVPPPPAAVPEQVRPAAAQWAAQPAAPCGASAPPAAGAAGAPAPPLQRPDAAWLAEVVLAAAERARGQAAEAPRPAEDELGALRRLEAALRGLEDRVERAEERARRAEEQGRRAEEELGALRSQQDQLLRRQQDDGALMHQLTDRAQRAEERHRRAEEELGGLRPQLDQLLRRQQEDGALLRSLQEQLREAKDGSEVLKRDLAALTDLKREQRDLRGSWEASTNETMQKALDLSSSAFEAAKSARQDITSLRSALAANTGRAQQGFEAAAAAGLPSRILHLQSQHAPPRGLGLGAAEQAPAAASGEQAPALLRLR